MVNFKYRSAAQLAAAANEEHKRLGAFVLSEQANTLELTESALFAEMEHRLTVMEASVAAGSQRGLCSQSGLSGGDAYLMSLYLDKGNTLCGEVISSAIQKALAVSEYNAAMGRIVAAPTAGSCGILPAAVLTMMEKKKVSREDAVLSLFAASGIGMIIANCATLAGAQGGCQAECGAASAMAAAAIVELSGGTPEQAIHAAAIALKNILGLVCDPVAGLVEIPCIKRNASGVANAFIAAELVIAGIQSAIPCDEVILAMKRIGDSMPCALRETADGGLAATPTGQRLYAQIFGKEKE